MIYINSYLSLVVQFTFVAQQHFFDIGGGIFFDISDPIFYVLKRFLLRYVIDKHNAHSTSVVCCGDRSETLLASSVPAIKKTPLSLDSFDLNLSIYHICNLIFLLSNSIVLILKSIPAIGDKERGKREREDT